MLTIELGTVKLLQPAHCPGSRLACKMKMVRRSRDLTTASTKPSKGKPPGVDGEKQEITCTTGSKHGLFSQNSTFYIKPPTPLYLH